MQACYLPERNSPGTADSFGLDSRAGPSPQVRQSMGQQFCGPMPMFAPSPQMQFAQPMLPSPRQMVAAFPAMPLQQSLSPQQMAPAPVYQVVATPVMPSLQEQQWMRQLEEEALMAQWQQVPIQPVQAVSVQRQPYMMPAPMMPLPEGRAAPPRLEGFLSKRGAHAGQAWYLRYFSLEADTGLLSYRNRQEDEGDQRRIPINGNTQVRPFSDAMATPEAKFLFREKPCGFEIFNGPHTRVWYLDAGRGEKLHAWVKTLWSTIQQFPATANMSGY